jgi:hypothetical protein
VYHAPQWLETTPSTGLDENGKISNAFSPTKQGNIMIKKKQIAMLGVLSLVVNVAMLCGLIFFVLWALAFWNVI